ncbi:LytR/AlgR family response regulator transcription factor [Aquimarina algicola]|nr:LytTR family DNA-binding domain-containing protein [Aquimarina algicola]
MFRSLSRHTILFIHVSFWILYYIIFGIIWVKEGDYKASFYLEFVLLPVRIFSVYLTVLYLIPQFLLKKKFFHFLILYISLLFIASAVQRLFMHFFVDDYNDFTFLQIFDINALLRAIILINSTVVFVSSVYILDYYFEEKEKNKLLSVNIPKKTLELRSNKRVYTIAEDEIIHIEGLGNYITYHLADDSTIVVYNGLKKALQELSDSFIRIHKSHIINKEKVKSYSKDNIELLNGKLLPIGNSVDFNMIVEFLK